MSDEVAMGKAHTERETHQPVEGDGVRRELHRQLCISRLRVTPALQAHLGTDAEDVVR